MSLQLYSQIPGTQVKRDANLSNATIQCDPSALYPLGATQGGVLLNKENLAGKIAVEHDLCNLDVNNLTVNGVLKATSAAEICDIVCPVDFNLTAGSAAVIPQGNININAHNNINLLADGPGVGDITLSTVGSTDGDIVVIADGDISMSAPSATTGQGNINLRADEVLNLNSSLISVLSSGASTENVDLASTTVANIAINTEEVTLQDDSSKNISLNTGTLLQSENKDSIVLNAGSAANLINGISKSLILTAGAQSLSAGPVTDSVLISALDIVDITGLDGIRLQASGASSKGISLVFSNTVADDDLKMTSANVNSTGANPAAQTITANAVHGTITMLQTTTIAGGAFISCTLTNNKIATNSTVLCSVNIAGNNSEFIVINGGGTTAGSYEFVLANSGPNNYASSATERIVISFLVINPTV